MKKSFNDLIEVVSEEVISEMEALVIIQFLRKCGPRVLLEMISAFLEDTANLPEFDAKRTMFIALKQETDRCNEEHGKIMDTFMKEHPELYPGKEVIQ